MGFSRGKLIKALVINSNLVNISLHEGQSTSQHVMNYTAITVEEKLFVGPCVLSNDKHRSAVLETKFPLLFCS